jgi:hypothetical protein
MFVSHASVVPPGSPDSNASTPVMPKPPTYCKRTGRQTLFLRNWRENRGVYEDCGRACMQRLGLRGLGLLPPLLRPCLSRAAGMTPDRAPLQCSASVEPGDRTHVNTVKHDSSGGEDNTRMKITCPSFCSGSQSFQRQGVQVLLILV